MLIRFVQTALQTLIISILFETQAMAGYDIGAPTSGPFAKLGSWLQDYVDFMDGPFAVAAVVLSLILALALWNFSPREGIMAVAMKAVITGIVILNIGTWISSFT